jgi:tetratricopeptide (TPR) repeat protein
VVGVALLAILAHANAFGNAFVFDDLPIIRDNPRIRSLSGVPALYGEDYWGMWGEQGLYRPFVLTTYALNYAAGKLDPRGYIAVNVALHAVASVLVLGLGRSLGAPLVVAGAAGLLFAVHPVHTEAVTGIVGRAELLAAVFVLLALLLHRRSQAVGRPLPWRAGAAAAYLLALLSKENAITLLGLAALGDALFPVRSGRPRPSIIRRLGNDYLWFVLVTVAVLMLRGTVVGFASPPATPLNNPLIPRQPPTALGNVYGATFAEAKLTAIAVLGEYLRLLLWPVRLSCDYSLAALPVVRSVGDLRFWLGLMVLGGVVTACVGLWRRAPLVAFGLGFLAVSFALSTNLVVRIGTICAERLLYLPSAGFLIAVAAGLGFLWQHRRGSPAVLLALLLGLALASARTWTRNRDWHDETALWGSAVQVVPGSAKAQTEWGRVLLEASEGARARGHNDSAESFRHRATRHLEDALRIYPESRPAANHLTQVALIEGDLRRAQELCQRSVRVDSTDPMAWSNWGLVLMQEGERAASDSTKQGEARQSFEQALGKLNRAIALDSTLVNALLNRGALYRYRLGRPDLALLDFRAVLRLSTEHPRTQALRREVQRIMDARDERYKEPD